MEIASSIHSYSCLEQKSLRAMGTWEQTRLKGCKLTIGLLLPPKVMDISFSSACLQLLVLREGQ